MDRAVGTDRVAVGEPFAGDALRAVLDAVDEGLLLLDEQQRLVGANARFWELFGLSPHADLATIRSHLAECAADPAAYLQAVAEVEPETPEFQFELVRPQRLIVRRRVAAVRDSAQRLLGQLISYRDVTRDAEISRLKSEFVANVSHELRTPMAAIKGFLTVVLEDEETMPAEQRRQFLTIAREQTERLSRLIEDLLDISRIESGRCRPVPVPFAVADLLRDVSASIRPEAEAAGLTLTVAEAPTAWIVVADRDQLAQVLLNLLSNAVKFTPAGGRVSVGAELLPDRLELTVSDTGCGIAPEEQALIFEKFYRARRSGVAPEGTGLGLAIARELIESHGGSLTVTSAPEVGSTFRVRLPVGEKVAP